MIFHSYCGWASEIRFSPPKGGLKASNLWDADTTVESTGDHHEWLAGAHPRYLQKKPAILLVSWLNQRSQSPFSSSQTVSWPVNCGSSTMAATGFRLPRSRRRSRSGKRKDSSSLGSPAGPKWRWSIGIQWEQGREWEYHGLMVV